MRKYISLMMLVISPCVFSSTALSIKDNNDRSVVLSSSNINRIFIKGDRISDFKFPKDALQIVGLEEEREGRARTIAEEDGSIYVTNVTNTPFTLFVSSELGRHFSLTISAKEGLGKTYEIIPETASKKAASKWESESPYEDTLTKLMATAIRGDVPSGYGIEAKNFQKRIRFSKSINLVPLKELKGDKLNVEVFKVENISGKPLSLSDNYFSKGALATSLSTHTLKAKENGLLYIVRGVKNV